MRAGPSKTEPRPPGWLACFKRGPRASLLQPAAFPGRPGMQAALGFFPAERVDPRSDHLYVGVGTGRAPDALQDVAGPEEPLGPDTPFVHVHFHDPVLDDGDTG